MVWRPHFENHWPEEQFANCSRNEASLFPASLLRFLIHVDSVLKESDSAAFPICQVLHHLLPLFTLFLLPWMLFLFSLWWILILWVSAETHLPLGSFPYPTIWVKLIIASGFHSTFFISLYFSQPNVVPCMPLALRNHSLFMLVTAILPPQWPAPALVPSRSSRSICWQMTV